MNLTSGEETRGECRISDGRAESGMLSCSELPRWWPPPESIKDHVGWTLWNKH
jgi:hypothetical protein